MARTTIDEPNCVRWQHEGGHLIYEATKDLSPEELLAWWAARDRAVLELQEADRREREAAQGRRARPPLPSLLRSRRSRLRDPRCVRMKCVGAERIRRETKGMTREQLLTWWKEREEESHRSSEERKATRRRA